MPRELPAHIWFVRSNGGAGSYPIRPEGWQAVWFFLGGLAVAAVIAAILAATGPTWLWVVVFAVGAAVSAWRFIDTARKHTDTTLTYNEYAKDKTNA